MGHLWKRNGVWYMGFKDRKGKWRQRTCGTRDKRTAEKKLHEAERLVAYGEKKPLSDFLGEYLKSRASGLSERGRERYEFCREILVYDYSPLAGLTLQEVDVAACTHYISWRLGHGRNKTTVAKEIAWLKAAVLAAAEEGHISWERAYQIRCKKWSQFKGANSPREKLLFPQEREILFDAARHNDNLHSAMTLAFWTGLRQENVLHLTEAQVDFTCDPSVIRLSPAQMKNKHGHIVLLAPEARALLWRLWQGIPARRFFLDFRPAWKRLKAKLEKDGTLTDFRFHDFRRTYVSYRIAAGIDPKTVQDEVGHRTSRMTMDCYARALKDPGIQAWAMRCFRFPWDLEKVTATYVQQASASEGGKTREARGSEELPISRDNLPI